MRLHQFADNDTYLHYQRRGSKWKSRQKRISVRSTEILAIVDYLAKLGVPANCKGLCHGVGAGAEVRMFEGALIGSEITGTDLTPLGDGIVPMDFHDTVPNWLDRYDFVYSNSLDHSNRPKECLRVWLQQVKPRTGLLFLSWSKGHGIVRARLPRPGGDCFGAALHEYIWMAERVGRVVDLLYHRPGRYGAVVLVVGRKQ